MSLAGLRVLLSIVVLAAQAVNAWDCLVANNVVINCPIPYKRTGTSGWFYNLTVTGTFAEPFTLGYYYQYLFFGGPGYGVDQWTSGGACNVLAPPYSCPVASDFKMFFQWYYPHTNPAAFTETVAVTITDQVGCPRISVGLKLRDCQPVSSSSAAAIGMLPIPWSSSSAASVVVDPNQVSSSTAQLMMMADESSSSGGGGGGSGGEEEAESSSGGSEGEVDNSSSPAALPLAQSSSSATTPPSSSSATPAPIPSSSAKKPVSSSAKPTPVVSSSAVAKSSSATRLSSSTRRVSSSAPRKPRRDFAVTDSTGAAAAELVDGANGATATFTYAFRHVFLMCTFAWVVVGTLHL